MINSEEFDRLMAIKKLLKDNNIIAIPSLGKRQDYEVVSMDKKEQFVLTISRGTIDISKIKYQNLYKRYNLILVRIDLAGPRHLNPDGIFIGHPHIHIYKEGYGDKWAYLLPNEFFTDVNDMVRLLEDFLKYCNIEVGEIICQMQV